MIGRGRAYCYPSRARQPGFAPGWLEAASPALRRFPAARVRKGKKGRYYVKVTYKRVNGRWRRTRESGRKQGPGYVAIRAVFKGKRLVPRGRLGFRVRYGADANGKPIWKRGPQQCIFEGRLRVRRRR